MSAQVNAELVKATREKYGLSQRAFASLLGLGEATIVRYEKGSVPSKANANLIRAADDPKFMAGCLERDGYQLTPRQRESAEQIIYACVKLDAPEEAEEEAMTINEIYDFTLRQEVLTERCANLIADIIRWQTRARAAGAADEYYQSLCTNLSMLKPTIADYENMSWPKLDRISGYLDCAEEAIRRWSMGVAS